jgi:Spy/CpxP family protein refolding chaperone
MPKLSALVVVVVLLTVTVGAQRPQPPRSAAGSSPQQGQPQPPQQPFKWWQSDRIKPEIGLTSDQSNRIEEIFQSMLPKLTSGKDDLDRLEKRVSAMIGDDAVSEAEVMKQVDRVEMARAELAKVRTLMFFRMHRVLTPEQRTKMTALREKWERERQGAHRR